MSPWLLNSMEFFNHPFYIILVFVCFSRCGRRPDSSFYYFSFPSTFTSLLHLFFSVTYSPSSFLSLSLLFPFSSFSLTVVTFLIFFLFSLLSFLTHFFISFIFSHLISFFFFVFLFSLLVFVSFSVSGRLPNSTFIFSISFLPHSLLYFIIFSLTQLSSVFFYFVIFTACVFLLFSFNTLFFFNLKTLLLDCTLSSSPSPSSFSFYYIFFHSSRLPEFLPFFHFSFPFSLTP